MRIKILLFLILQFVMHTPLKAEIVWHWQDRFDKQEKQKLTTWIEKTVAGLESLVGPYPFHVHITFHRRHRAGEPVPWANTERQKVQGVHFHVDPSYSLDEFLDDWTAPHELSHLVIPYLGPEHAWFAEGFASYMQYQVMHAMGIITEAQANRNYEWHLRKAKQNYHRPKMPFAIAAASLRAERRYPTMYWGGATYFLQVKQRLAAEGKEPLPAILREYMSCCRHSGHDLNVLLQKLDRLSGSEIFTHRLRLFKTVPGFPDYASAFREDRLSASNMTNGTNFTTNGSSPP